MAVGGCPRLGAICGGWGNSHGGKHWTLDLPWLAYPVASGQASTAIGAPPAQGALVTQQGPQQQCDPSAGQNPRAVLLPGCPPTSMKATAATTLSPGSPTAVNRLPLSKEQYLLCSDYKG